MNRLLLPETMAEVDRLAPDTALLAGGTDLLVQRRAAGGGGPLADISRLADAPPPVRVDGDTLRLSALAPLAVVSRDLGTVGSSGALPGLRAAIALFASAQIRNRATLGGNLANASPAADTVPPLVAAGAVARLRGPQGTRTVPVAEFASGPRRTCLGPGEWIESVEVNVPTPAGRPDAGFRKVAGRRALAISTVSLAWSWVRRLDGTLADVRLAAGAVAPVVVRCTGAEAALEGRIPTPAVVREAALALHDDIRPIDDLRGSADYRRAAAAGVLAEALAAAGGEEGPPEDEHATAAAVHDTRRNT